MLKNCIHTTEVQSEIAEQFESKIIDFINYHFKHIKDSFLLAGATLLDPRFGKKSFNSALCVSKAVQKIIKMIKSDGAQKNTGTSSLIATEAVDLIHQIVQSKKKPNIWDSHDEEQKLQKINESLNLQNGEIHFEQLQFLKLPRIDRKEDPFLYWRDKKEIFPLLSSCATKQLTALATSVPSKRTFSKAEQTKSDI